ncbi:hypothetical protein HMPREF0476_1243 [Kingella kingae ATCC 23330]|uniref:Uncharacterized protein n=1 Tax=Kingella kingae ATCC 23330 TaxID=887327 RepID=F5S7R0_KINKI|nr:hypothetical protein HMPREF0476_1243 [Kingella kingae ATCC 23330]
MCRLLAFTYKAACTVNFKVFNYLAHFYKLFTRTAFQINMRFLVFDLFFWFLLIESGRIL